jgi:TPR repeat protein
MYKESRGGLPENEREAAGLFKLASDQGNATGQAYLGQMYEYGQGGLAKDDREAARLYRLAADQRYARAQFKLGQMYEEGLGNLPKDKREALRLYKLAADGGDLDAVHSFVRLTPENDSPPRRGRTKSAK